MAKKRYDDDDGRTIVSMNIDGMPGYIKPNQAANVNEIKKLNLSKSERRAIFWGSFKAFIPLMFFMLIGFALAFWLVSKWLS